MSDSDLKFVIFREVENGYRWRLRSARGETVDTSQRRREDRYPGAAVRDLTVGRFEI